MAGFFGVLKSRESQLTHEALKKAAVSIARKLLDEAFMAQPQNHCKLEKEIWAARDLIENRKDLGAGIERGRHYLERMARLAEELKALVYAKASHITTYKVFSGNRPTLVTTGSFLEGLASFNIRIMLTRVAVVSACFYFEFHVDRPFLRVEPDDEAKLILTKKIDRLWRQQDIVKGLPDHELARSANDIETIGFVLGSDLVGVVGLNLKPPIPAADNDNSDPTKTN